jgi:NAD(P)-dependent dehydrogenase (short-subunit alcohol dehydrogenase family)
MKIDNAVALLARARQFETNFFGMLRMSKAFAPVLKANGGGALLNVLSIASWINGVNDIMVPTINSWIMSQHVPQAQLIVYPDAGRAAHYQYPELFLNRSRIFLDS